MFRSALRHISSRRWFCSDSALSYNALVVGAGPAGLSAAIRLKQLSPDTSVCVLEKGSEVGAHILSGNVLEPRSLDELFPDWRQEFTQVTPVSQDRFSFLTSRREIPLPTPPQMHNRGNYIISLSQLTRWLGEKAEELGVEIFPGFAGKELIVENDVVKGVRTGEFGIRKDGRQKENYEPGVEIRGDVTILAEGSRGSLTKEAMRRYGLERVGQTYALGVKEVWRVRKEVHSKGRVVHTIGYPLDWWTYGGGFVYHLDEDKVAVGFVVGLDYWNEKLSPFGELQRFKLHPSVRRVLEGGEVLQYGARVLNEGGWQSLPNLEFAGGCIVGCAGGMVNVPKIKGTHTAMKSGMLAAEAISQGGVEGYEKKLREGWVGEELKKVRNVRPGFKWGLGMGVINAGWETLVGGRSPWTLRHEGRDHEALKQGKKIEYPKAQGVTLDILSAVNLSGTNHDHDEPCHLHVEDMERMKKVNWEKYEGPEGRYCPAKVYEWVEEDDDHRLQINAQNCLHCKACDIKDPTQNINWTVPQGGGGPKYTLM